MRSFRRLEIPHIFPIESEHANGVIIHKYIIIIIIIATLLLIIKFKLAHNLFKFIINLEHLYVQPVLQVAVSTLIYIQNYILRYSTRPSSCKLFTRHNGKDYEAR